jgi:hypothetical protein
VREREERAYNERRRFAAQIYLERRRRVRDTETVENVEQRPLLVHDVPRHQARHQLGAPHTIVGKARVVAAAAARRQRALQHGANVKVVLHRRRVHARRENAQRVLDAVLHARLVRGDRLTVVCHVMATAQEHTLDEQSCQARHSCGVCCGPVHGA